MQHGYMTPIGLKRGGDQKCPKTVHMVYGWLLDVFIYFLVTIKTEKKFEELFDDKYQKLPNSGNYH